MSNLEIAIVILAAGWVLNLLFIGRFWDWIRRELHKIAHDSQQIKTAQRADKKRDYEYARRIMGKKPPWDVDGTP